MRGLRFLVVEGNTRAARETHKASFGKTPGESYGDVLVSIAPKGSHYDICCPADADGALPEGAAISGYDGVVLTGSALHLWQREPAVDRQIDLSRAIFAAKVPFFGSCWGLQMAAVAAGGDVQRNPQGREIGFARKITVQPAGQSHGLLADRPPVFDAPAIHLDIVVRPPADCTVLASNRLTPVQAAEIRHAGGVFWGVQYHPEFTLTETGVIMRRLSSGMVAEGHAANEAAALAYADNMITLDMNRSRHDLAWSLGIDHDVLDDTARLTELRNWISRQVINQPTSPRAQP